MPCSTREPGALQGKPDQNLARAGAVPAAGQRHSGRGAGAARQGKLRQRIAALGVGPLGAGRQRPSTDPQVSPRGRRVPDGAGRSPRQPAGEARRARRVPSCSRKSWPSAAGWSCPASTSRSAPPPSTPSPTARWPSWPGAWPAIPTGRSRWKATPTASAPTAANRALSRRRAEAVRARLAERHGVDTRAWGAVGYGATRPRESNATIEGRARNRRVELVRDCS